MRTTLDIDGDVLATVKDLDHDDALFPRFPKRGGPPVTNELVRRVQDEIDTEDATPWDHERDRPRTFDEPAGAPKRGSETVRCARSST